ncbi:MAG: hypothetical protein ACJAZO_002281 [Myxococcota bacterium]
MLSPTFPPPSVGGVSGEFAVLFAVVAKIQHLADQVCVEGPSGWFGFCDRLFDILTVLVVLWSILLAVCAEKPPRKPRSTPERYSLQPWEADSEVWDADSELSLLAHSGSEGSEPDGSCICGSQLCHPLCSSLAPGAAKPSVRALGPMVESVITCSCTRGLARCHA